MWIRPEAFPSYNARIVNWLHSAVSVDQHVFYPLDPTIDIAFRYPIAGRDMRVGPVFPQIFQGGQQ